jgi:SAM-dependent methyltransferase
MSTAPHDASYRRDELEAAERWHFWFQARRELVLWAIGRFGARDGSLLDVGCGTGFVLEGIHARYPHLRLAGSDADAGTLERVMRRVPDALVFQGFAADLPFREHFDVVTALDVIEHIDDDREALASMCQALKPGGLLVVTVPQHPSLWSEVDDFSRHRRRYTRRELIEKVRTSGYAIERCTSCFFVTLPMLIAARRRPQRGVFDPLAELRIPKSLNRWLRALVGLESAAIRAGLSLPAGGSLLMVARRSAA